MTKVAKWVVKKTASTMVGVSLILAIGVGASALVEHDGGDASSDGSVPAASSAIL